MRTHARAARAWPRAAPLPHWRTAAARRSCAATPAALSCSIVQFASRARSGAALLGTAAQRNVPQASRGPACRAALRAAGKMRMRRGRGWHGAKNFNAACLTLRRAAGAQPCPSKPPRPARRRSRSTRRRECKANTTGPPRRQPTGRSVRARSGATHARRAGAAACVTFSAHALWRPRRAHRRNSLRCMPRPAPSAGRRRHAPQGASARVARLLPFNALFGSAAALCLHLWPARAPPPARCSRALLRHRRARR